jgi:hypothetical protein
MDKNQEMDESQEKVLNDIIESYDNGRLVPFVGSGISKSVENFLTWDEFIQKLSKKLTSLNKFKEKHPSITDTDSKYFLESKFKGSMFQTMSAEYYALIKLIDDNGECQKIKRDTLRGVIQDEIKLYLDPDKNVKSNIHKILLDMFSYIYTTNWDKLFEYVIDREKLEPIFSIGKISELWDLKEKREKNILIKMHGTCDEADSIIALETDYLDLLHGKHKNMALNNLFECDIMQRDFLFIGFSFTDLSHELSQTPKLFLVLLDDYDYFLKRYYLDIKGVDVYFISNVSEKGNSKTKAIEKFLYDLEFSRLDKLNKGENKEPKIEGKIKGKNNEPLTPAELSTEISRIKNEIKKDFEEFKKEKIKFLEKKIELLKKNIKLLEDEKLNKEDCKPLEIDLNSLKMKLQSKNVGKFQLLMNLNLQKETCGNIKKCIDSLDDNDINNDIKSLKKNLEGKFPYDLIKEFKKNIDDTEIELKKYNNKKESAVKKEN